MLQSLLGQPRVACGLAAVADVRTGALMDWMPRCACDARLAYVSG